MFYSSVMEDRKTWTEEELLGEDFYSEDERVDAQERAQEHERQQSYLD